MRSAISISLYRSRIPFSVWAYVMQIIVTNVNTFIVVLTSSAHAG
jgi:hypothetical protein